MTREVSNLRPESEQKCVDLNDSNEELRKKSREIKSLREGREQDSEELSDYSRQVEAQSEEIAGLRTPNVPIRRKIGKSQASAIFYIAQTVNKPPAPTKTRSSA